jgi:WhiB family redox-sensing transcriptional regulator
MGQRLMSPRSLWTAGSDDGPEAWQQDGLCRQTDAEVFFPEKGQSTRSAKAVCARCPVQAECLEWALEHDERFGIWGGLSERERRKLAPARVRTRAPKRARPVAESRSRLVDCPCARPTCKRWVARGTRNQHLRQLRGAQAAA